MMKAENPDAVVATEPQGNNPDWGGGIFERSKVSF